jgi:hypothetical protein
MRRLSIWGIDLTPVRLASEALRAGKGARAAQALAPREGAKKYG